MLLKTLYDVAFNIRTQVTCMADMETPMAETLMGAGGMEGPGAVDGAVQNSSDDAAAQDSKTMRRKFLMVVEKYSRCSLLSNFSNNLVVDVFTYSSPGTSSSLPFNALNAFSEYLPTIQKLAAKIAKNSALWDTFQKYSKYFV